MNKLLSVSIFNQATASLDQIYQKVNILHLKIDLKTIGTLIIFLFCVEFEGMLCGFVQISKSYVSQADCLSTHTLRRWRVRGERQETKQSDHQTTLTNTSTSGEAFISWWVFSWRSARRESLWKVSVQVHGRKRQDLFLLYVWLQQLTSMLFDRQKRMTEMKKNKLTIKKNKF